MLEFTPWAVEIVEKADAAARRLNPDARVRLSSDGRSLTSELVDAASLDDRAVSVGRAEIYVAGDLGGLIDVEEPHDRLVLKPAGSPPNEREPH